MNTEWFYEPLPVSGFTIKQKDPDGLRSNPICAVYLEEHARMICAAPEMLEFIKLFREARDEGYEDEAWLANMADEIIAKAKGGTL